MGKTLRNINHWTAREIKTKGMEPRKAHRQVKNQTSYSALHMDPRSMKITDWRAYNNSWKYLAKRAARHKAKIMVRMEAYEIMQIEWEMESESWWYDEDDWYQDDSNWYDYSFKDEAYDYSKLRRQEEMNQLYDYDMYPYEDY